MSKVIFNLKEAVSDAVTVRKKITPSFTTSPALEKVLLQCGIDYLKIKAQRKEVLLSLQQKGSSTSKEIDLLDAEKHSLKTKTKKNLVSTHGVSDFDADKLIDNLIAHPAIMRCSMSVAELDEDLKTAIPTPIGFHTPGGRN